VTVTSTPCGNHIGTRGRLTAVDWQSDLLEPYHVSDGRGHSVWASSVHRSRIQFPEFPYRPFAVAGATIVVAIAALVGYGHHEAPTEPMQPMPFTVTYGPMEAVPPYAELEDRPTHTDRTGERAEIGSPERLWSTP
jgi:hypothetical protein